MTTTVKTDDSSTEDESKDSPHSWDCGSPYPSPSWDCGCPHPHLSNCGSLRPRSGRRAWSLLALGLILCVGAALRLTNLSTVPPGLWFDEALNAQDAMAVWQPGGHFKLVYPDEFPREPLYETMLALVVRVAGPSVVAMRALSATLGILTILLLYLMLRREGGQAWALCAAGVLATMRWHVIFSHLIFRTLILGPWMLGIVWAALSFRRRPSAGRALLLGVLVGGGFYTYLGWYFLLPVVGGILLWLAWAEHRRPAPAWRWLALAAGCALLTYLPLGIHYLRVPSDLLARPGAVSVFGGGLGAALHEITKNAFEAVLMFHWRGDHVPKQNIPRWPALDLIQGILFLYGLGLCVAGVRKKRPLPAILLAWIACGLAATIFTKTDSPNFLRTLCITPAVAIVTGLGLTSAAGWLARRTRFQVGAALAGLLLCLSAFWTARDVYANWARRPDVWQGFNGDLSDLARFAAQSPKDVAVFVPADLFSHRSFQFQTLGHANIFPYSDWSILKPWPPSAAQAGQAPPRRRWIIVTANNRLLRPLHAVAPAGRDVKGFVAPMGNTWAAVFALAESDLPAPPAIQELEWRWHGQMRF